MAKADIVIAIANLIVLAVHFNVQHSSGQTALSSRWSKSSSHCRLIKKAESRKAAEPEKETLYTSTLVGKLLVLLYLELCD